MQAFVLDQDGDLDRVKALRLAGGGDFQRALQAYDIIGQCCRGEGEADLVLGDGVRPVETHRVDVFQFGADFPFFDARVFHFRGERGGIAAG